MKLATPMSCTRQASTTFSGCPPLSACVALCSKWLVVAKRALKKSIRVGLSGIFGSRGSAPMRKCFPGIGGQELVARVHLHLTVAEIKQRRSGGDAFAQ